MAGEFNLTIILFKIVLNKLIKHLMWFNTFLLQGKYSYFSIKHELIFNSNYININQFLLKCLPNLFAAASNVISNN